MYRRATILLFFFVLSVGSLNFNDFRTHRIDQLRSSSAEFEPCFDKMSLWNLQDGPHLRGANIYQRRVYLELDGPEFMGPGPVGPPYTQEDFYRLAEMGANYVNIEHPGLFTEKPPYVLDEEMQESLDRLLEMVERADLFAVISFRTGPGRSEFTFFLDEVGDWFDESYLNDNVWIDQEAQDAWVEMWRYVAERYRDNPVVVGYDIMVEPNSNEVWLDIWDPEEFYSSYSNTLYDWNQLYPRIIAAIREVDPYTPILVEGMAYSCVEWFPYLRVVDDPRVVYVVHQYEPYEYTHQYPYRNLAYPGAFDVDGDGEEERFDKEWINDLLSTLTSFAEENGVQVAVNEFGVVRWAPGAAEFMKDQMDFFEQHGINYALWVWDPMWEPWAENDASNFRHGPDPKNHEDVESSDLIQVIKSHWTLNEVRPSSICGGLAAYAIVQSLEVKGDERDLMAKALVTKPEGKEYRLLLGNLYNEEAKNTLNQHGIEYLKEDGWKLVTPNGIFECPKEWGKRDIAVLLYVPEERIFVVAGGTRFGTAAGVYILEHLITLVRGKELVVIEWKDVNNNGVDEEDEFKLISYVQDL